MLRTHEDTHKHSLHLGLLEHRRQLSELDPEVAYDRVWVGSKKVCIQPTPNTTADSLGQGRPSACRPFELQAGKDRHTKHHKDGAGRIMSIAHVDMDARLLAVTAGHLSSSMRLMVWMVMSCRVSLICC